MSKIPKIIHYCWFGDSPMPPLAEACIKTWEKYLPDYQLKLWSNEHIELFSSNRYVREAFDAKKYAFITDYVRLYALYHYGGIYLDTDVECKKNLDEFLSLEFFTSSEDYYGDVKPVTALMAAVPGNKIIADLLSDYDDKPFKKSDGTLDVTPNTILITNYFSSQFNILPPYDAMKFYELSEKQVIFPAYYFCQDLGEKTYTVHHFAGSWLPRKEKIKNSITYKLKYILKLVLGDTLYLKLKQKTLLFKSGF